jgi:hypothetical protein
MLKLSTISSLFARTTTRSGCSRRSAKTRLNLEALEGRELMSVMVVNTGPQPPSQVRVPPVAIKPPPNITPPSPA